MKLIHGLEMMMLKFTKLYLYRKNQAFIIKLKLLEIIIYILEFQLHFNISNIYIII